MAASPKARKSTSVKRSDPPVAQEDNSAEPAENSNLVLDFIKLAAATATASAAANKRSDQKSMHASGASITANDLQQESKFLPVDERYGWSYRRASSVQQHVFNPVVLPAVHSESDSDSSALQRPMIPQAGSQSQELCLPRTSFRRPRWISGRSFLTDPASIDLDDLTSNSVEMGGGAKLLLQNLECGQSGSDLVQVSVTQLARHELWTGNHHSSWTRRLTHHSGSWTRKPRTDFSPVGSWTARNGDSSPSADVLPGGSLGDERRTDEIGRAVQQPAMEETFFAACQ
jgi:hypothetical protein